MEKGVTDRIERLAAPSDPNRPAPPQGGDGSTGAAGNVGGYNNFWIDAGDRVAVDERRVPHARSSSTRPTAGCRRSPTQARARQAERLQRSPAVRPVRQPGEPAAGRALHRRRSARTPGRRCCPTTSTTTTTRSCRRSDHVMIMTEMVHDARIIRIGKDRQRLPAQVRPWMGRLDRPVGGRHAGRRDHQLPPAAAVPGRLRHAQGHRAVLPRRRRHAALQVHHRRPEDVHAAVERRGAVREARRADLRIRLPRGQLRVVEHPERRTRAGRKARTTATPKPQQ